MPKRADLDMDAITEEYLRGDSLPQLGRRHGANAETIRRRLRAAGVVLRDQPSGQRARYNRRGDLTGLAIDLQVDEETIRRLLVKHGFISDDEGRCNPR